MINRMWSLMVSMLRYSISVDRLFCIITSCTSGLISVYFSIIPSFACISFEIFIFARLAQKILGWDKIPLCNL